ncbi:MAG: WD40 repeat domain-containing protein, partial [bacterium]|nr:WD40 repeat domain-containing protein [Candidatus Minthenecus merdequi]
ENVAIHSYSPDSKYIAMGKDSIVKIWNVESGEEVRTIKGHGDIVMSAFFSRDGKSLLTSSRDGNVMLWNLEDTKQNQSLTNYSMGFSQNSFSPDKKHIALYSTSEKAVMEYDIQTGKPVRKLFSVDIQTTASYSQDGKFIVTSPSLAQAGNCPDTMARVWNANGELISTLQGHNKAITSSSFSPDGKYVVTSSYDTTACVWSITGKLIHKLKGHKDCVSSASFSPDGKRIVTSSMDNTAIIWDAKTGRQMQVLKGHTEPLSSAVFSPDDRYIATSSIDNDLIIWDAVSGKKNKILRNLKGYLFSVAFSPDSRYVVATSTENHIVVVFDVESGEQIIELKCMYPTSAAFTPDGKQIAAISLYPMISRMGKYSYIRFWRFYQPQELIDRFRSVVGNYSFTPYEEIKYYLK